MGKKRVNHGTPIAGWFISRKILAINGKFGNGPMLGNLHVYIYILVGGFNHLEKMSSSMGRIIPYIMENKKCLKPPTSIYIYI